MDVVVEVEVEAQVFLCLRTVSPASKLPGIPAPTQVGSGHASLVWGPCRYSPINNLAVAASAAGRSLDLNYVNRFCVCLMLFKLCSSIAIPFRVFMS